MKPEVTATSDQATWPLSSPQRLFPPGFTWGDCGMRLPRLTDGVLGEGNKADYRDVAALMVDDATSRGLVGACRPLVVSGTST